MKKKKLLIPLTVLFSVISGCLYRAGGSGNFPRQARVIGVPLLCAILLAILSPNWAILGCIPLMIGAISTYWDFMFKGKDNFYMHGFMVGIACFPLFWAGIAWWLILSRSLLLGLGMGIVNKYVNKWGWKHSDIKEECFRGALIVATIPLLLL